MVYRALAALCTLFTFALTAVHAAPNPAPDDAKPAPLFNGKDLSGWVWIQGKPKEGQAVVPIDKVWSVKPDGVINDEGTPIGYLRTEKDYTNYKLTLEWRFPSKPGNGGVLLRMIGEDKVWPKSIEAQLQSRNAGDIWNIDEVPMQPCLLYTSPSPRDS